MGSEILPGQSLVATTAPGGLNQLYGLADANQVTVTATSPSPLSSTYTIPAGEAAYAGTSYEMECSGYGTWGSTARTLNLAFSLGGSNLASAEYAAGMLSASATFAWVALARFTCADGISAWWGTLAVELSQTANPVQTGTVADNSGPAVGSNSSVLTEAVTGALACVINANWGGSTCTITKTRGTFRKVA